MKSTTKPRAAQVGPTLGDLLRAAGRKPAQVEAATSVSVSTVYRAMRGEMPHDANVRALADYLAKPVDEVRAAIARGTKGAVGRPRARKGAA